MSIIKRKTDEVIVNKEEDVCPQELVCLVNQRGANRLPWIDFLRGIAMACVVYWHCSSIPQFNAVTGGYYLPMFYALSGYLFSKDSGLKLGKLFWRIYFPLFIFGILPNVIGSLIRLDLNTVLSRSFYISTSWFLPTFFASTIIFRIIAVYIKEHFLSMIVSIFILLIGLVLTKNEWAADYYTTNICFSTILVGQCCIMMGYMWKKYENSHKIFLKEYKIISLVSFCSFLALEFITEPGSAIDFHTNSYPNIPIGMGIVLSSLLLGYSWARNINFDVKWLNPFIKFICFLGRYAIFVFLLHHTVIAILDRFLIGRVYPHIKQDYFNAFIYMTLTLICCYIIITIIKKFVPFLLGEKQ